MNALSASPNRGASTDPVASAMGNAIHCSAHFCNPAISAGESHPSFYASFLNEYEIKELCSFEGSLLLPSSWSVHSVRFRHFGFEQYSRHAWEYGLGKRLSERWCIGAAVRLSWVDVAELPEKPILLHGDVGATCRISRHISVGALARNIAGAQLTSSEMTDAEEFSLTAYASVRFLDNAQWCVEAVCFDWEAFGARNGFEYKYERLSLRCGFSLPPIVPTLGCGFDLGWLTLDASTHYHSQLGYSFAVGLGHVF